jgi:hypothetical protein
MFRCRTINQQGLRMASLGFELLRIGRTQSFQIVTRLAHSVQVLKGIQQRAKKRFHSLRSRHSSFCCYRSSAITILLDLRRPFIKASEESLSINIDGRKKLALSRAVSVQLLMEHFRKERISNIEDFSISMPRKLVEKIALTNARVAVKEDGYHYLSKNERLIRHRKRRT